MRRRTNKRLDEFFHSEKIYKSNVDKFCSVAGNTSTERSMSFGASMVYMGWAKHFDFQLYQSNPTGENFNHCKVFISMFFSLGNYGGWKVTCWLEIPGMLPFPC